MQNIMKIKPTNRSDHPEKSLKRNNIVWIVIFLLIVIGLGILSGYAFYNCRPSRFYFGIDSWGNICTPSSYTTFVKDVNGSGKTNFNKNFLWLLNFHLFPNNSESCFEKSDSSKGSIKICVKNCPGEIPPLNAKNNCLKAVVENDYIGSDYVAAEAACNSFDAVSNKCNLSNEMNVSSATKINENHTNTVILGRCAPLDLFRNGYVHIENYLSFWHYLVYDLLSSSYVIAGIILLYISACIFTCLVVINYPRSAFYFCNFFSIILSLSTTIFLIYKTVVAAHDPKEAIVKSTSILSSDIIIGIILSTISAAGTILLIIFFVKYRSTSENCEGFMIRISKCFHLLPKLLSQPLWTIIVCITLILYTAVIIFYCTNCHVLEAADDYLTAQYSEAFPVLGSPGFYLSAIFVATWGLNIIKTGQQAVIADTVHQWYFSKDKSNLLHPITKAVFQVVFYKLGGLIGCSFNGSIQFRIVETLSNFIRHNITKNKVNDDSKIIQNIASWTTYLSPISPIALGIYGSVRPTNICGNLYWDERVFNKLNSPTIQRRKKSITGEKPIANLSINQAIQYSHASARWCFRSCHLAFVLASSATFMIIRDHRQSLHFFKTCPFLITIYLSYLVCDICLSIMTSMVDAIAICLYEDLDRNNGDTRLFYSSRGLIYKVAGLRVLLTATYGGVSAEKVKAMKQEKQKKEADEQRVREEEVLNKGRQRREKLKLRQQQSGSQLKLSNVSLNVQSSVRKLMQQMENRKSALEDIEEGSEGNEDGDSRETISEFAGKIEETDAKSPFSETSQPSQEKTAKANNESQSSTTSSFVSRRRPTEEEAYIATLRQNYRRMLTIKSKSRPGRNAVVRTVKKEDDDKSSGKDLYEKSIWREYLW